LAPVTIPDLPRSARSAITGREITPTAPSDPAEAPSASTISSAAAGRTEIAPVASMSFCSSRAWSPRSSASASFPSSTYTSVLICRSAGAS
jgi:hypothetical protein